jgi:hypothetical protein
MTSGGTCCQERKKASGFLESRKCYYILFLGSIVAALSLYIGFNTTKEYSTSSRSNIAFRQEEEKALLLAIASPQTNLSSTAFGGVRESSSTQESLPLCTRQDIRVGHWKPVVLDAPPYVPGADVDYKYRGRCPETIPNASYATHEWQPSNQDCHFTKFDAKSFCQLASMIVTDNSSNDDTDKRNKTQQTAIPCPWNIFTHWSNLWASLPTY